MTALDPAAAAPTVPAGRLHQRVRHLFRRHVSYRQRSALLMWLAFGVTFGVSRSLTLAIHDHWIANTNVVTKGGLHIHHFVWGIVLLLGVGFAAITAESPRWHPWMAVMFGIGSALVIDEFALWLNLKDVYWQRQGQVSVELGCIVLALLGVIYVAQRFWRCLYQEISFTLRAVLSVRTHGERTQ